VDAYSLAIHHQLTAQLREKMQESQSKAIVEIYGLLKDMSKDVAWYYQQGQQCRTEESKQMNHAFRMESRKQAEVWESAARDFERRRDAIAIQMKKLSVGLDL